jgi:bis(5'-nucleosyl)-tetraphosphatase (symmetrical)
MVWAIGDIQGCFDSFMKLLERIDFDTKKDTLWIAGDIVNRGDKSLETLLYLYSIRDRVRFVLGNHDIALIATRFGVKKSNATIEPILSHKKGDELIDWLRDQPFVQIDSRLGFVMSHAGIAPNFDLEDVISWNEKLKDKLTSDKAPKWLKELMGNRTKRAKFKENPEFFAFSSFIRMRYCFDRDTLDFESKLEPSKEIYKSGVRPWFEIEDKKPLPLKIIFGHWSTLGYFENESVACLDSGCLWGSKLTAKRLDSNSNVIVQSECQGI